MDKMKSKYLQEGMRLRKRFNEDVRKFRDRHRSRPQTNVSYKTQEVY
jgi:hypothetical protein